jgi:hypothetical protein
MPNTAHRFHIELVGIEPPVWRRIRVPSSYSFWDLHVAIQDAMGWLDYHLHLFQVRNPETGALEQIGIPDDEPYLDEPPCLAGWEVPIARYLSKKATPLRMNTTSATIGDTPSRLKASTRSAKGSGGSPVSVGNGDVRRKTAGAFTDTRRCWRS